MNLTDSDEGLSILNDKHCASNIRSEVLKIT